MEQVTIPYFSRIMIHDHHHRHHRRHHHHHHHHHRGESGQTIGSFRHHVYIYIYRLYYIWRIKWTHNVCVSSENMICMCIYLCIHVYWRMFTKFTPTMTRGLIWASKMNGSCEPRFLCEMPSLTLPTTEEKGIENRNAYFSGLFNIESSKRSLEIYPKLTLLQWSCRADGRLSVEYTYIFILLF